MNILDKTLVLKLNKAWQVIDEMTVGEAVTFLCSESHGRKPGFALDFVRTVDENGKESFSYGSPLTWEQWVALPVREGDMYIGVGRSAENMEGKIRVPHIVICANYEKVHLSQPRVTPAAVWERDQGVCQYTGEKVTRETGNLDHVIPRDRGGKDTFDNLVVAKKSINTKKSNKLNHEVGLKLLKQPKAPGIVPPVVKLRKNIRHPSWEPFLLR